MDGNDVGQRFLTSRRSLVRAQHRPSTNVLQTAFPGYATRAPSPFGAEMGACLSVGVQSATFTSSSRASPFHQVGGGGRVDDSVGSALGVGRFLPVDRGYRGWYLVSSADDSC